MAREAGGGSEEDGGSDGELTNGRPEGILAIMAKGGSRYRRRGAATAAVVRSVFSWC